MALALGLLEKGDEALLAQRLAEDVRPQFYAQEAGLLDGRQLLGCQVGVLHGRHAEAVEAPRLGLAHVRDLLVDVAGHVEPGLRGEPVGQQLGHRRDHLSVGALTLHLLGAPGGVPADVAHGPEVPAGDHDIRAAGLEMFHARPTVDAGLRELLRDDVRVQVDDHCGARAVTSARNLLWSPAVPMSSTWTAKRAGGSSPNCSCHTRLKMGRSRCRSIM